MAPRRVLITAVSSPLGTQLASRLAADPAIRVFGLDTRPPRRAIPRMELLETDIRAPGLTKLLPATRVDTVVHNEVLQFPEPDRGATRVHDINVMGTLQLLAACELTEELRTLVVRGSASIYGAHAAAPQFFTEDMAQGSLPATRFQRDMAEIEELFATFAGRHPQVTCTLLRMQPIIGPSLHTPITRLFTLPVVPTNLGFDPRLQLTHEDDAVGAMEAAVRHPVPGAVNVASEGTVTLTRLLRMLRRPSLPIPHPLFAAVAGLAQRAGVPGLSEDTQRYLRYGRGVDTTRMREELGFEPQRTTLDAVQAVTGHALAGVRPAAAIPAATS